jgi:hypothetical protein
MQSAGGAEGEEDGEVAAAIIVAEEEGVLPQEGDVIRVSPPASLEEACRLVTCIAGHYNTRRFQSAIGYVTPHDLVEGRQKAIHEESDRKLEAARETRAKRRKAARQPGPALPPCSLTHRQPTPDSLHP